MRRLKWGLLVAAAIALACSDTGGPSGGSPRAQLNFVLQDSTYKPLLSTQGTFYAKVGEHRQVRLVYQGSTPTDSGAEFLRFEVPSNGLYRKPDGTPFGPVDSILITVTVVDPKQFRFDFQPSGLQFNPSDPARLRVEYHYAEPDFDGNGTIDSRDAEIEALLSLWQREPPDTLWFKLSATRSTELERFDADIFGFSQYAVAW
jgi:hypothetical protein